MARGENIDSLISKSKDISATSYGFYQKAK